MCFSVLDIIHSENFKPDNNAQSEKSKSKVENMIVIQGGIRTKLFLKFCCS